MRDVEEAAISTYAPHCGYPVLASPDHALDFALLSPASALEAAEAGGQSKASMPPASAHGKWQVAQACLLLSSLLLQPGRKLHVFSGCGICILRREGGRSRLYGRDNSFQGVVLSIR